MAEPQRRAMEMERHESEVVVKRCVILHRATLLEEGFKISRP
jgi:hypothetical protein